jgi:hypothetical protein
MRHTNEWKCLPMATAKLVTQYLFDEMDDLRREISTELGTTPLDQNPSPLECQEHISEIHLILKKTRLQTLSQCDLFDKRGRAKRILSKAMKVIGIKNDRQSIHREAQQTVFELLRFIILSRPEDEVNLEMIPSFESEIGLLVRVLKEVARKELGRSDLIECLPALCPTLHDILAETGWDTLLPIGHPERSQIGRYLKTRICQRKEISREEYDDLHLTVPVNYSRHSFRSYPDDEREDVIAEIESALQRSYPFLQVSCLYLLPVHISSHLLSHRTTFNIGEAS